MRREGMILVGLMSLLLGLAWRVAAPVQASGTAAPAYQAAREEFFFVDWNITGTGQTDMLIPGGARETENRNTQIQGSAIVRVPEEGDAVAYPFQLTVTDETITILTGDCFVSRSREFVVDPGRYNNAPDSFWVHRALWQPVEWHDGTWRMLNPLGPMFYSQGALIRQFLYQKDTEMEACNGSQSSTVQSEGGGYWEVLMRSDWDHLLESDEEGLFFAKTDHYVQQLGDMAMSVSYNVTVRRACTGAVAALASATTAEEMRAAGEVCGCASLPKSRPIDASDPIITHVDIALEAAATEVYPDGSTQLKVRATCEGVPVKNYEFDLSSIMKENTGGHFHRFGEIPRGFMNDIELDDNESRVEFTTGPDGTRTVTYKPPKDYRDKTRGISGRYLIFAYGSSRNGLMPQSKAVIEARVPGLVELQPGTNYTIIDGRHSTHEPPLYGTPSTLQTIAQLANDFVQAQEAHNAQLRAAGQPEWPIAKPGVYIISLQDGGLYDHRPFQTASSRRTEWMPPYSRHRFGTDVQWAPISFNIQAPGVPAAESKAWLISEFTRLGQEYGSWYNDSGYPMNLAIGQSVPNQRARGGTGADVGVVAFLSGPDDVLTAHTGQTVTYTVGLNNADGTVAANGVVLRATLPQGLAFVSASPAPTRMEGGQPVWEVGTLPAGALSQVFTVVARVDSGATVGSQLALAAEATTSTADADPANNEAEALALTVLASGADLAVFSELGEATMEPGMPVTFPLEVVNIGNATATGATLALTLPLSTTLQSAEPEPSSVSGQTLTWNVGTLAADASQVVSVTVVPDPALMVADEGEESVKLAFTLEAESTTPDADATNNVDRIEKRVEQTGPDAAVDLSVQGADAPGTLTVGEEVTYTLHYGNYGTDLAPGAVLTASLGSGLSLVSATVEPQRSTSSATFPAIRAWEVGDLAPGDMGVIHLRVRVDAVPETGSLVLATIASGGGDRAPANNVTSQWRRAFVEVVTPSGFQTFLPFIRR